MTPANYPKIPTSDTTRFIDDLSITEHKISVGWLLVSGQKQSGFSARWRRWISGLPGFSNSSSRNRGTER